MSIPTAAGPRRVSFCMHCGNGLEPHVRFCPACGAPVRVTAPPALGNAPPPVPSQLPTDRPPLPPVSGTSPPQASRAAPRGASHTLSVGSLSPEQTGSALRAGLLALAAVSAIFVVVACVLALTFADSGHHGSPIDWFRSGVVMVGLAVHSAAQLHLSGDFSTDGGEKAIAGQAILSATVTPLLLTVAVALVAALLSGRRERAVPSTDLRALALVSAVSGGAFAVAAALLAAASTGGIGFGGDEAFDSTLVARVGVDPWRLLPGAFLVVTAGALLGRARVFGMARGARTGRDWLATQVGPWRSDIRHVRALFLAAAAVTVLAAAVAGIAAAVHTPLSPGGATSDAGSGSGLDARQVAALIVAAVLALPNILVAAVGATLGGTLGSSASAGGLFADSNLLGGQRGGGVGLLAGGLPVTVYLVTIPMLVAMLAVGARIAYARSPSTMLGPHIWRTASLFALIWAALGLLLRGSISLSGSALAINELGDGRGAVSAGLGLPSLIGATLAWAVVSTAGGSVVARFLAAAAPRLAFGLGGKQTDPDWRLLIASSVLLHGSPVPLALAPSVAALREGAQPQSPPLTIRPLRDRSIIAAAAVLVVALIGGFAAYPMITDAVYGPTAVVNKYFADLRAHDVDGALGLVSSSTLRDLDLTLLTEPALTDLPAPVSVRSSDESGQTATVTVDEGPDTADFSLVRQGTAAGVFPVWRLQNPFTHLELSGIGASSSVTVGSIPVSSSGSLPVFPGTYTVTQSASGPYQSTGVTVHATGDGVRPVTLTPSIDPSAVTAATDAVRSYLDTCATSSSAAPPGCPFAYYDSNVVNGRWTITEYPGVSVSARGDGTIEVSTDSAGSAHLSGLTPDGDGYYSTVSDDESVSPSGTLDWSGGDPTTATLTPS